MKPSNNVEDLLDALDTIRREKFPEIPKDLLEAILLAEFSNQDNRAAAQGSVQTLLDTFLKDLIVLKPIKSERAE